MLKLLSFLLFVFVLSGCGDSRSRVEIITPNQFRGTDIQRIQAAIDAAEGTTNKVFIPSANANGTNIWLLDSAILVPGDMTIILENCTLQLSDRSRDNMFRSKNAGIGIKDPEWISNISIVGVGDVLLKGADNPRSTGDGGRTLIRDPSEAEHWRVSYGRDAGKEGMKQTGDWRNIIMNVIGYGRSLIHIEEAVADCYFSNCIYLGDGDEIITYKIDKDKTRNIVAENMIKRTF